MMETVNELDGALEGSLKMNFHQLHSLVIKLQQAWHNVFSEVLQHAKAIDERCSDGIRL